MVMKKIKKNEGRGEFIPKKGKSTFGNKGTKSMTQGRSSGRLDNVMDSLSKLDPAQLVQLGSSVASAMNACVDLGKEREKTKQVEIQAALGMAEIKAKTKESELQYQKSLASLQAEDVKDQRRHEEAMKHIQQAFDDQSNKHHTVMDLIDKVERGVIPVELLAELIHQVKAKS